MDATSTWLTNAANNRVPNDEQMFVVEEEGDRNVVKVKWPTSFNGQLGDAILFKWEDYKKKVDKGWLTDDQKRSVYGPDGLRKKLQIEILKWSVVQNREQLTNPTATDPLEYDPFYNEMGSLTSTSDLDFSYIRWDVPLKIVPIQVSFYNKHYEIMGLWPLEAFDMNFYAVTGFVKNAPNTQCWAQLQGDDHVNVRALFDEVWQGNNHQESLHEFAGQYSGNKAPRYKAYDSWMAYIFIQVRFNKGLTEGQPEERIERMIRYSAILYYLVNEVKTNPQLIRNGNDNDAAINHEKLNLMKIYMKTLRYLVNYWSDEAYFSNQALQLIMNVGVEELPNEGIYLAILDNLAFINHYFADIVKEEAKKEEKKKLKESMKFLKFWDRASKYIYRAGNLVDKVQRNPQDKFIPGPIYHELKPKTVQWLGPNNFSISTNEDYNQLMPIMKDFNLHKLAERWVRKWNDKDVNGALRYPDGEKKIRGDVPAKYLERNQNDNGWKVEIPEGPQNAFLQAAVPEARAIIWKLTKSKFTEKRFKLNPRSINNNVSPKTPFYQLYNIMCGENINGLRGFIEKTFFDIVLKDYQKALQTIYESVDKSHKLMKDKIKVEKGEGQIVYAPLNPEVDEDAEIIRKFKKNPFVEYKGKLKLAR